MTTRKQLVTGLSGTRGSDFDPAGNLLYFVEVNTGNISVLDMICRLEAALPLRTVTMALNTSLDLVSGVVSTGGDIRWDNAMAGQLMLRPQGPATFFYAGIADFDHLTHAELQNVDYVPNPGGEIPNSQLAAGSVVCVLNTNRVPTNNWDYAKIRVDVNTGTSLKITWVTYRILPRRRIIGTGYTNPMDIKLTADGRYAYVTDIPGNFLRVDVSNANRANARLIATGLDKPHQIFLDEAHGQAYLSACTPSQINQTLFRIDLSSGTVTPVFSGLPPHWGLLLTKDLHYAYVFEEIAGNHRLLRLNLADGRTEVLLGGLIESHYMEWADSSESRIMLVEGNPANRVTYIDLTANPVVSTALISSVPLWPFSLVKTRPDVIIVCSESEINQYTLTGYSVSDPLFLGIGLVPVTNIINSTPANNATDGYATTDPGYMLQVKDAPFGGSLAIMINHGAARQAGAKYYKLFVNQITPMATVPTEPRQSFSDYLWSPADSCFKLTTTNPDAGGFYPVRDISQLWYNPHLGYMLNSAVLSNGLCLIDIKIYNAAKAEIPVRRFHSRRVKIDNQWPVAVIEQIIHDGSVVPVCQIVNSGTDMFSFKVTATDPEGHMLSWSLWAVWGNNKSAVISSDDYSHHVSPTRKWTGLPAGSAPVPVPAWHAEVPDDPTSTRCAHTFYLGVWDRVINGYGYLHYQSYHKSITIWL